MIGQLAARYPDTWGQIPRGIFNYGGGGIASGGAVCGGYNGAQAVLRLMGLQANAQHYHRWFENTYLPTNMLYTDYRTGTWTPTVGTWGGSGLQIPLNNAPKVKPFTTTCHGSHARWKAAAGAWLVAKGSSANQDRCGKLTADCVYKLASMINELKAGGTLDQSLDPSIATCKTAGCHLSGGYPETGVGGFMKCQPCHQSTAALTPGHGY